MFKITEIKIHLIQTDPKLLAFADVVLDGCFKIHDLKVLKGDGRVFVNMPSRRITDRCHACNKSNAVMARFCSWCGAALPDRRPPRDENGHNQAHFDICHPVTRDCREMIEAAVLSAYGRVVNPKPLTPIGQLDSYGVELEEYEGHCAYE